MSNFNDTLKDKLDIDDFNRSKLPSGLNILTILTFIGCAIGFIGTIYNYMNAENNLKEKDKIIEKIQSGEISGFVKALIGDPEKFNENMMKSYENRLPILLLSLIAIGLCFWGALEMRKMKKQGFMIYTIGELMPILISAVFISFAAATTGIIAVSGVVVALLFVFLYFMQRKYLVY